MGGNVAEGPFKRAGSPRLKRKKRSGRVLEFLVIVQQLLLATYGGVFLCRLPSPTSPPQHEAKTKELKLCFWCVKLSISPMDSVLIPNPSK